MSVRVMVGAWHVDGFGLYEWLGFVVPLCTITLIAFVWAAFIRSPDEKHSRRHHWWRSKKGSSDESRRHRGVLSRLRNRRRHRRKDLPRNPTLAETRGLPSARTGEPESSRPN